MEDTTSGEAVASGDSVICISFQAYGRHIHLSVGIAIGIVQHGPCPCFLWQLSTANNGDHDRDSLGMFASAEPLWLRTLSHCHVPADLWQLVQHL